ATEQLRDLFSLAVKDIDTMAATISPGADGVITLPFYNGERTPALPNGKAVIFGLSMDNTTQAHLLRSAMEAAIFGLKTGLLAFQRCNMHFDEVTLTGGGSTSGVWRQICADVLNMPVKVLLESENAAFGAALQALWCLGLKQGSDISLEDLASQHISIDQDKVCTPIPENVAIYESVYGEFTTLLNTISPLYKK
ncbi:MAG: FGGY-family carbohydrate kinase, partial [Pseudomonadales bacterium]